MVVARARLHGWLHGDPQGMKAQPLWEVPDSMPFSPSPQMLLWSMELFLFPKDFQDLEGSIYRLFVILRQCLSTQHMLHFLYLEENLFQKEASDLASL